MNSLLKILIILILLSSNVYAESVKSFKIIGNQRISDSTIILFSKVNKNDDVQDKDLNKIIKNLYSTNFFEDVKISLSDQVLIIEVIENPIVQKLVFNGLKKKSIISTLKPCSRI